MHLNYELKYRTKPTANGLFRQIFRGGTCTRRLVGLLIIIIGLGFVYAAVPPTYGPVRGGLAIAQFGFMIAAMIVAINRVLADD